jgi:predicted methyltransferase
VLKTSLGLAISGMLAGSPTAFSQTSLANNAAAASDPAGGDQAAVDARRHGPEILSFAGVTTGDKVVDLVPGPVPAGRRLAGRQPPAADAARATRRCAYVFPLTLQDGA